jgi:hypothetical protein
MDMQGAPVALADLQWLYPELPSEGSGRLQFRMVIEGDSMPGFVCSTRANRRLSVMPVGAWLL